MSTIPLLLIPIFVYALCTGLGVSIILWSFHKRLIPDVFLSSLLPICLWLIMSIKIDGSKGPSNFIFDPLILGAAVCMIIAVRFALEVRPAVGRSALRAGSILACLAVAVAIFYMVPFLPREP